VTEKVVLLEKKISEGYVMQKLRGNNITKAKKMQPL